jgi:Ca2+-transporting ATPase
VDPVAGLSSEEVARRRADVGANELDHHDRGSGWRILAGQFGSPVIWLLFVAAGISAALGERADAIAIVSILVINACVGFAQEYRAERAIQALRTITAPRARVIRDGHAVVVLALDVVPGDHLVLEPGDIVAADATLVDANVLTANEAPLTGESVPVEKTAASADRVFMGTSIATGTGRAVVSATGMRTELGKIATLLATAEQGETPLQRRLAQVNRTLIFASLGIVVVVAGVGLVRGLGWFDVFLSAVALAVAAVPEGLPTIITIALALGMRRMAARHALVRRLPAVETLGNTTVICTDKTGTLTTGIMTVRRMWSDDPARLLDAAVACCDAELGTDGRDGTGDPTELAILARAAREGIDRATIEAERPRIEVIPFDPRFKFMAIRRADGVVYVKGAVEVVASRCVGEVDDALEEAERLAASGLRVLAVAVGPDTAEAGLELVGLMGLADPPRPEAIAAVAAAHAAGIRVVMITGDHPITAVAIARELGIVKSGEPSDGVVRARATPEDKLLVVRDLKARGEVVAMTGDGVNDAPALREAHVGIAMGKTGTEVTREVSDVVLADDNFATIVAAVREGRAIFDNIRNALVYLLSGNLAELSVMLLASFAGLPLPLLPLQLLWINLVTDGLPALALVMDPPEAGVMDRPPRATTAPLLGRTEWRTIVSASVVETAVTLGAFEWALQHHDLAFARGIAFTVLVFSELLRSFAARSPTRVFWQVGVLSNVTLLGVIAASVAAQLAVSHVGVVRDLFEIAPISIVQTGYCLALAAIPVTVLECSKLLRRR